MQRTVVVSLDQGKKAFEKLLAGKPAPIFFDIETTGLNARKHQLVTLAFHNREQEVTVVLDARHWHHTWAPLLRQVFHPGTLVVGHNIKFDAGFIRQKYDQAIPRVFDTMLAEQIIEGIGTSEAAEMQFGLNLKAVADRRGIKVSKGAREWFFDLDQRPEWTQPLPLEQVDYIAQDVEVLPAIFDDQLHSLKEHKLVCPGQIEFRALRAFVEIEQNGMPFDVEGWRGIIREKEAEAQRIESELMGVFTPLVAAAQNAVNLPMLGEWLAWDEDREATKKLAKQIHSGEESAALFPRGWEPEDGEKWGEYKKRVMGYWKGNNPEPKKPPREPVKPNLSSPKQVQQFLAGLGLNLKSTSTPALEPFKEQYPEVKLMIEHRKANKFVVAFGEGLLAKGEGEMFYEDEDGLLHRLIGIHPDIQQIGASTGRTSMRNPNLQQIPARGPDGKRMRAQIKAPKGWKILAADQPNMELRLLAEMSGDENMIRLFNSGADLHAETARFMFNLAPDFDTEQYMPGGKIKYRDVAKAINFGLMYGMSARRLAGILKCTVEYAQELLEKYFSFYPGVRRWLDATAEQVYNDMFSRTPTGRWRRGVLPSAPTPPRRDQTTGTVSAWANYKERLEEFKKLKARWQRQGVNHQVQGWNADITKEALALFEENRAQRPWKLIGVVHDELVVMAPEDQAEQAARYLSEQVREACLKHIKKVMIPEIKVSVSDHWAK